jgi:hypothetical protein
MANPVPVIGIISGLLGIVNFSIDTFKDIAQPGFTIKALLSRLPLPLMVNLEVQLKLVEIFLTCKLCFSTPACSK